MREKLQLADIFARHLEIEFYLLVIFWEVSVLIWNMERCRSVLVSVLLC